MGAETLAKRPEKIEDKIKRLAKHIGILAVALVVGIELIEAGLEC